MENDQTVTVYTTGAGCMACKMTKKRLDGLGISYIEELLDEENLQAALELGYRTAPIVLAVSHDGVEQGWDGYRPDRIDGLRNPQT